MTLPIVAAVSRRARHTFSKSGEVSIRLLAGLGVDGDAHQGETVKHRSRVARDPSAPNRAGAGACRRSFIETHCRSRGWPSYPPQNHHLTTVCMKLDIAP